MVKREWEWGIRNIHDNRNRKGEQEMGNQEYERQIGKENRQ